MEGYNGYTAGDAAMLEGKLILHIKKKRCASPYAQLTVSQETLLRMYYKVTCTDGCTE